MASSRAFAMGTRDIDDIDAFILFTRTPEMDTPAEGRMVELGYALLSQQLYQIGL